MDTEFLLLAGTIPETIKAFVKHYQVEFFVAVMVLLAGFFRKRLINLTGSLVAVKVHGLWDTTIQPDDVPEKQTEEGEIEAEELTTSGARQLLTRTWSEADSVRNKSIKITGEVVPSGEQLAIRLNGVLDLTSLGNGGQQLNGSKQLPHEEPHETARLYQFFNKVWGETECKDDRTKTFKVRGQIIGEKLVMVYRSTEGSIAAPYYCI